MMKRMKIAATILLTFILLLISFGTVNAAVIWDPGSMKEVYNPQGERYSYAPSVIRDGDTAHIWTCHNDKDGVIKDHIYYTRIVNDTVAESRSVLQAGPQGSWDSFHVCDPSVIAGEFHSDGEIYHYAMFYLGNDLDASLHNQIGVAFAKELSGEWVKHPKPLLTYPNDGYWGIGQPSATSIDGKGRLLLFFTQGDSVSTGGYRVEMDLLKMEQPVIGDKLPLTNDGLINNLGESDFLNNFDIAYNSANDRFIAVRELHPYPSDQPNWISSSQQIISIEGSSIWGGGGQWKIEGTVSPALTSFDRNHNAGLLRTAHGTLPDGEVIDLYFTGSDNSANSPGSPLYTYNIWRIRGQLTEGSMILEKNLTDFNGKLFSVHSMTNNLHTNTIEIQGMIKNHKLNDQQPLWVGYRIYDSRGYLLEAGTAYRDIINKERQFSVPIIKPEGIGSSAVRLEIQLLSAKGKLLEAKASTVNFGFNP
ncbi:hypothetical protein RE628_18765 [Paenibacillus sp. D2_2]|uniref:hypothetical protein n=1 Tax=Paenibacillus sp. D2_2 TaxID=3073092 RepID=UPI002814BC8E|nr:hypothetical protein [Paenibacillus sp. D2_2]WMT39457.1 hypothetical protein RE628_18765 [Paenibacillus sp. D2_2]